MGVTAPSKLPNAATLAPYCFILVCRPVQKAKTWSRGPALYLGYLGHNPGDCISSEAKTSRFHAQSFFILIIGRRTRPTSILHSPADTMSGQAPPVLPPERAAENKGPQVLITGWALTVTATLFVASRMFSRFKKLGKIGAGDYIVLLSLVPYPLLSPCTSCADITRS